MLHLDVHVRGSVAELDAQLRDEALLLAHAGAQAGHLLRELHDARPVALRLRLRYRELAVKTHTYTLVMQ